MSSGSPAPGPGGEAGYDWRSEENHSKWRGIFVPALQKVLTQVHPNLVAREDALEYVEVLILRLLAMLTAKPTPLSVQDVEDRVSIIITIIVNFGISISNINISIILNATILTLNGSNQMRRKIFHVSRLIAIIFAGRVITINREYD